MQLNEVNQIEFEVTSQCNAGCLDCPRTVIKRKRGDDALELNTISLSDIKRWIPNTTTIGQFKLSGNLGDAGVHPELYEMLEYFGSFGISTKTKMHTNGGMQSEIFWRKIGRLSYDLNKDPEHKRRMMLIWAIDGLEDTNHIYRVGVKWNKLIGNLNAYLDAGGLAEWHFISFPHNEHQVTEAQYMAKAYGMDFVLRKSSRNTKPKLRATKNTHSQIDHPLLSVSLDKKEKEAAIEKFAPTVSCLHHDNNSLFIASNNTLWPCCMLWDEHVQKQNMYDYMPADPNWNNLNVHDIQDILDSSWFRNLEEFWTNNILWRCIKSCGEKGKLGTEFTTKEFQK